MGFLVAACVDDAEAAEADLRSRRLTGIAGRGRSRISLLSNAALVVVMVLAEVVGNDSFDSNVETRCDSSFGNGKWVSSLLIAMERRSGVDEAIGWKGTRRGEWLELDSLKR